MTTLFLKPGSVGIEVGAGSRPFPVPASVTVEYGDVRDRAALETYFSGLPTLGGERTFDAQTLAGISSESLDFVLSGHVIEHLEDPISCIVNTIRALKIGGVAVLAVPDMRLTFDSNRPETTVAHVVSDVADGGAGTRKQAFEEHLRFVHPMMCGVALTESEIDWQVAESLKRHKDFDLHYHAWTMDGFMQLLLTARDAAKFDVVTAIPIENENIFVLKRS